MNWFRPKRRLHIQVFENGIQKDLNQYVISQLVEIQKGIADILPQNPESAVLYDVQICETHKGWNRPPQTTLELVAYTHYKQDGPNLKHISVPEKFVNTLGTQSHPLTPIRGHQYEVRFFL
jgi:hypothetical protein